MPAPTPIQIRYGMDPTALGGLALATGTARRQYAEYQNQLAADRSFLQNELSRRIADTRYRNNFNLSLLGMQASERAARDQATALQNAAGLRQRQAAQSGGVAAPIARAGQPITLVPEEGPIEGTQFGGGSVTFRERGEEGPGDTFFSTEGRIVQHGGPVPPEQQGGYVRAGQPQGIPLERRSALDYIETLRGMLPEPQLNAMRVAARDGSLGLRDLKSLVDDVRAGMGGGGRSPGEKVAESAEGTAARMYAIESISNPQARREEKLRFMGYKVGSSEYRRASERVDELWESRQTGVSAYMRAGDYRSDLVRRGSGGPGSSSSNPVSVSEPSDLRYLSGQWVRTPDGRTFRAK